jgi:N-methylhydantoinase B/oxoprolinase/acetone carboxylase alpha subunit
MATRKKSAADTLTQAISSVSETIRNEAGDYANTVIESFKKNLRRRTAKRKPDTKAKVGAAKRAAKKVAKTTERKAKTTVKRAARKTRTVARKATRAAKKAKSQRRKPS